MLNPIILLQIFTGVGLLAHGIPKMRDLPGTLAWFKKHGYGEVLGMMVTLVETFGSAFLILGIIPRIMAVKIGIVMFGAMMHHWRYKEGFRGGWEEAYLYFIACVVIVASGGVGWF